MKKGFTSSSRAIENRYSSDLLKISDIFSQNLKVFFSNRIKVVETASLKLGKVQFTIKDERKSNIIENKTKQNFGCYWDIDQEEQQNILNDCTKAKSKQYILNVYHEVLDRHSQDELQLCN